MEFYLLDTQDAEFPCRWIENEPIIKGVTFQLGHRINSPIPDPLEYTLEPLDPDARDCGPEMPAFFDLTFPLFRDDFLAAMVAFGVDNLDRYNAAIFDPDNGKTYTNYSAINVIGLVAAADMQASDATVHDGVPLIDVDFDRLVLDGAKADPFLLFRLAEKTTAILVREDLKNHLVTQGFTHVCFGDLSTSAI